MLLAFVIALIRQRTQIAQMSRLGPSQLAVMSVTIALGVLLTGCTTRLYLAALGVRISVWEAFWLAAVTYLCSYLPLQLNLLIRAKYLRHLHSLTYAAYTAMVITNLGVMLCAIGIYGLLSLGWLGWLEGRHSPVLYALFTLCAVVPPVVGGLAVRRGPRRIGRWRVTGQVLSAAGTICGSRKTIVLAVGLTVVALFAWTLRFYQAAQHVAPNDRLQLAVILPPVATLSTYLAVTPSGLGIRELISSGLTRVLGMDYTVGLAVTTIERAVSVVWYAILGAVGTLVLGGRFRNRRAAA